MLETQELALAYIQSQCTEPKGEQLGEVDPICHVLGPGPHENAANWFHICKADIATTKSKLMRGAD